MKKDFLSTSLPVNSMKNEEIFSIIDWLLRLLQGRG